MVNFIMWLLVGATIGRIVTSLIGTRESLPINIIVGIVGAFAAGLVLVPYFGISALNQLNFSLPAMLISIGGAVMLPVILHFFLRWGGLLR